jgi:hypothetical protein
MIIREAIYSVFEGAGISSDDFPVRKRFIYRELKNTRNELIKQELNKYRMLISGSGQLLECLPMVSIDPAQCLDCDSGMRVLRSVDPLPIPIECDFGQAILGVYLLNGVAINMMTRDDWDRRKRRRYRLADQAGYFISNRYLHIVDYDDVDELLVNADGHWEDPEKIALLNLKNNPDDKDKCMPIDMYEFHCPGHIARRTIEIVRSVVFRRLGIPADSVNNSQFDSANVKSEKQPGES